MYRRNDERHFQARAQEICARGKLSSQEKARGSFTAAHKPTEPSKGAKTIHSERQEEAAHDEEYQSKLAQFDNPTEEDMVRPAINPFPHGQIQALTSLSLLLPSWNCSQARRRRRRRNSQAPERFGSWVPVDSTDDVQVKNWESRLDLKAHVHSFFKPCLCGPGG